MQYHAIPCNTRRYHAIPCYTMQHQERLHGGNQISDKFVVVDFERAIHNALLEIFPDATLYGCVWHFKHSLTQKVAKLAIKRLYNQSKEFKKLVSMIGALVWCPPADIPGNWTSVKNFCAGKLYVVPGMPNDQCFPCLGSLHGGDQAVSDLLRGNLGRRCFCRN